MKGTTETKEYLYRDSYGERVHKEIYQYDYAL